MFRRNLWRKNHKKKKKGLFGGQIKSKEEIKELNRKINLHEAKQLEQAEADLDEALKDM